MVAAVLVVLAAQEEEQKRQQQCTLTIDITMFVYSKRVQGVGPEALENAPNVS